MLRLLLLVALNLLCSVNGQVVFNRTFLQPALITSPTGSSSVCVGSSVIINCTTEIFFTGGFSLIPSTIWRRAGVVITDSTPGHTLLPETAPVTGLMVDSTTLDDDGTVYTCTIDGAPDDFTSSVVLNVTGGPPSNVSFLTTGDTSCLTTSVSVSWSPSTGDPACGPVSYNVRISSSDGVMMMRINDTSYNFTGLTPGTDYTVSVAGMNMAGVGQSDMSMFRVPTMDEAVPSKVMNLQSSVSFSDVSFEASITVTWDAADSPYCGDVLYYLVMISSNNDEDMFDNVTELTATFDNLINGTTYSIKVVAVNRVGNGSVAMTLRQIPGSGSATGGSGSDSLSSGAIIGIACGMTLLVTITAIVTSVIIYMVVKRTRDQDSGKQAITSTNQAVYETVDSPSSTTNNDLELQQNPAYGTNQKVFMDTNPAYESYK